MTKPKNNSDQDTGQEKSVLESVKPGETILTTNELSALLKDRGLLDAHDVIFGPNPTPVPEPRIKEWEESGRKYGIRVLLDGVETPGDLSNRDPNSQVTLKVYALSVAERAAHRRAYNKSTVPEATSEISAKPAKLKK